MLLPKVANTSIKMALADVLDIGATPATVHDERLFEYVTKKQVLRFKHRIAFTRDPLTRLASCYRDKIVLQTDGRFLEWFHKAGFQAGMPFLKFIEKVADIPDEKAVGGGQHIRSMSADLADAGDRVIPNWIGHFERLDEHWMDLRTHLLNAVDLELPPLTHTRKTAGKADAIYCPRGRAFARQRYRHDIRLFGYRHPYKWPIDPDGITVGRSICNVLRETYQVARDRVDDPEVSKRLTDLIAEAFDMGKRMNAKLGQSQYEPD